MGTWIEIFVTSCVIDDLEVVPYVGTWIEIVIAPSGAFPAPRRSLRGNVDRNEEVQMIFREMKGRSLRGNVDRNCSVRLTSMVRLSCSLRGNVDRNTDPSGLFF